MVSVFVGQLALKVTPSSVFRNASRIVVHPDHDEFLMSNDIAVVELDKDLPLNNKFIRTIPLNKQTVPANTSCMVSGWGLLQFEGEGMSQELLTTEVYTVDMTECTRRYQVVKIKLGKGAMCAVNDYRVSDACQGDSGGPLVCAGQLVGVISTGKECGNASFPGVYTDVRLFVPWIERVIKESEVTVTPPNSPRSQTVLSLQTPPESASSSKTFQTLVLTLVAIAQSVHILSDFCLVLCC
jgi:secreted trypsin-like serine protease